MNKKNLKIGVISLLVVSSLFLTNLAFAMCAKTDGRLCGQQKSKCCACECCS